MDYSYIIHCVFYVRNIITIIITIITIIIIIIIIIIAVVVVVIIIDRCLQRHLWVIMVVLYLLQTGCQINILQLPSDKTALCGMSSVIQGSMKCDVIYQNESNVGIFLSSESSAEVIIGLKKFSSQILILVK